MSRLGGAVEDEGWLKKEAKVGLRLGLELGFKRVGGWWVGGSLGWCWMVGQQLEGLPEAASAWERKDGIQNFKKVPLLLESLLVEVISCIQLIVQSSFNCKCLCSIQGNSVCSNDNCTKSTASVAFPPPLTYYRVSNWPWAIVSNWSTCLRWQCVISI